MKPIIVYEIINLVNNMRYVGSSIDAKKRGYSHLYQLKNNTHYNKLLQDDYNKYGEENFEIKTIYQVYDEKTARELEREYILENKIFNEYNRGKF